MTDVAPSCPVSYGQPIPGARVYLRGDPWRRIRDIANQIPRATDLRSAIHALNIMSRLITEINRTGPQVNNVKPPKPENEVEKGEDFNPHYQQSDWMLENRVYDTRKIVNPDDEGQFIEVKVLTRVTFFNANTSYRLTYGET